MTQTIVSMLALLKEATIVLSTPLASISAMRTFLLGLLTFVSFSFFIPIIIQSEIGFVNKNFKKFLIIFLDTAGFL